MKRSATPLRLIRDRGGLVVRVWFVSARASRRSIAWRSHPGTREDDRDLVASGRFPARFPWRPRSRRWRDWGGITHCRLRCGSRAFFFEIFAKYVDVTWSYAGGTHDPSLRRHGGRESLHRSSPTQVGRKVLGGYAVEAPEPFLQSAMVGVHVVDVIFLMLFWLRIARRGQQRGHRAWRAARTL